MKKFIRIICVIFIVVLINGDIIYASSPEVLDQILMDSGVEKTYRQNIINYMEESNITSEELDNVIDLTKSTVGIIGGRSSITDFDLSELIYIYGNVMSISNSLNIKIHINFISGDLTIINKLTGNILFQGDVRNLNNYYCMYNKLISNETFIKGLMLK